MVKRRNPVAKSPLLRKGGVHRRGKSAQRSLRKHALKLQLGEWLEHDEGWEEKMDRPGQSTLL